MTAETGAGHMSPTSTLTEQAQSVCSNPHTPEQLEAAIRAQGDLVEWHHMCGKMALAREALGHVKVLVGMRTPETVAALEEKRGLARA
jgi:hypothetical protein